MIPPFKKWCPTEIVIRTPAENYENHMVHSGHHRSGNRVGPGGTPGNFGHLYYKFPTHSFLDNVMLITIQTFGQNNYG